MESITKAALYGSEAVFLYASREADYEIPYSIPHIGETDSRKPPVQTKIKQKIMKGEGPDPEAVLPL